MSTAALTPAVSPRSAAAVLQGAGRLWFAAAVIGQALFLTYILVFYVPSTLSGDFAAWAKNTMLITGYVAGDTAGNLAFGAHVLMAAVVTFGGTLQLVPQIRARAPGVHRWVGRAFMTTAIAASVVGLWMTWGRGTAETLSSAIAITIDAVLIFVFAALAWRMAVKRNVASHRRWAMRAFIVANGVWFMRLGFVAYGMARSVAGDVLPSMGAFFQVWNFGAYLLPLAILELYLLAQARGGPSARLAMAGGLTVATLVMSVGIAGSWFGLFAPVLAKL
ncbi:MAG: DUF2306 domain-containing protein [Alphaproteobacteria bacterium]|nr:DUF2306 domain-containing protein [Alphaproteobacteria bacterium]MBU1513181.1 DUF2306 domain-containing protein [Alphaproteobacteria bacterium]MBU2095289.1 DUF2306 domain-containing protein [Alphaproteobacteria bacterium]MBU2152204.1 DUF2306 domain-containing protein [Alphaproteobacteria bacterium]MBU2306749.1 DUF2306 domain-containing protein [Alphaproteobacteria bacterium]